MNYLDSSIGYMMVKKNMLILLTLVVGAVMVGGLTFALAEGESAPVTPGYGGPSSPLGLGFGMRSSFAGFFGGRLTQAQRDELMSLVTAKLSEWGIEAPVFKSQGIFADLTQDQKDQLIALVKGMKESDATPAEIREAVTAKLSEWGIELPSPRAGCGIGVMGAQGLRGHTGFGWFQGQAQGNRVKGFGQGVTFGRNSARNFKKR
jgi:hypothetical protein